MNFHIWLSKHLLSILFKTGMIQILVRLAEKKINRLLNFEKMKKSLIE